MITTFEKPFLNNDFYTITEYNNMQFPTAENAFQASKYAKKNTAKQFQHINPRQAALKGNNQIPNTPNWFNNSETIMYDILKSKFSNPDLKEQLIATYPEEIVHVNGYHDTEWGICTCTHCCRNGENKLGKLLMKLRDELMD